VNDLYETVLSHPADADDEPPDGVGSVRLETHLSEVGERARQLLPTGRTMSDGDDLGEVAEILGRLHDFGKLTTFFQAHVRSDQTDGPTHHARLGAFVTYYALDQCGYGQQTRIAGTIAVWKHHGALPDVANGLVDRLSDERTQLYDDVCDQVADIDRNHRDLANKFLSRATGGEASWAGLTETADSLRESLEEVRSSIRNELFDRGHLYEERVDEETYTDLLQLSSALVLADKTCAGDVGNEKLEPETADLKDLKTHLEGLGGDPKNDEERELNRLRDAAQNEVTKNVQTFLDSDESVATITLPTGYGKTLVGLRAALEIQAERDTEGRIVYALPFTSIIDQTAETLQDVFGADPTGRKLTIHHHLAETVTVGDEYDGDDGDTANDDAEPTDRYARDEYLVGESWRSGMTLTTFVQLFESLAGPGNTQSMKLPTLYGSVVIVDEPQAVPLRWWPLVERLIEVLTETYDARVILMTATQPEIVDESFDLIQAKHRYFDGEGPDRVSYEFDQTVTTDNDEATLGYDEAAGRLVAAAREDADSALAVCNTIDSARDLSEAVAEGAETEAVTDVNNSYDEALDHSFAGLTLTEDRDERTVPAQARARLVRRIVRETDRDDLALLHLSTRLRPCDRRALLQIAEDLTALNVPLVVVSTQLIEAGVDISFDRVYRDFAPLDSIVQAAGRCNRSFDRNHGRVTVWQLDAPEGCTMLPSKAVYARVQKPGEKNLLRPTRNALGATVKEFEDGATASEATVAEDAVETYHRLVGDDVTPDGIDMVDDFEQARARSLRQASLIEQQLSFEVYVCRTEPESNRVAELRAARREWDFEKVEQLRKTLAELRVSVPVYRADSDAARELKSVDPLFDRRTGSDRTNWDDETERVLDSTADPSRFRQYFDAREGVHLPENGVEARFF